VRKPHLPQGVAEGAAPIGFLDAQGQGAAGAHAGAVGVGNPVPAKGPTAKTREFSGEKGSKR